MQVRFQEKGLVSGSEWIYDYIGWLVPVWPNSTTTLQRPAMRFGDPNHPAPFRRRRNGTCGSGSFLLRGQRKLARQSLPNPFRVPMRS